MMLLRLSLVALSAVALSAQADSSGDALFSAIQRGVASDVGRVLDSGVSPDLVDDDGTPALMAATLFADADTVRLLLERGADPNRTDTSGATALIWAVPDLPKARLLVEHGADVNARPETLGRTPLLVAAAFPGTVDLLRFLLDRGADLRAQDRAGAGALALAVRSSDVDVVRFLVATGLDPESLSPGARRAGLARYDRPTVDYLMSKGLTPTPDVLIPAATWQPAELVRRWIELGADSNVHAPRYDRTPLSTAVASEMEGADTVRLLLERGADPNARTTEGETALDWAIYKGDQRKIRVLQDYGATRGDGPRRQAIAPPERGPLVDSRASVTRAVARLLDVAPSFREKASCVSCHHNALPGIAAGTARQKGIAVDRERDADNRDDMLTFFRSSSARMMLGDPAVGGEALTTGYVQLALAADGYPLDKVTATMSHWLIARQMPDGRWLGNGLNRPPSEYSPISHTAIAAGGLKAYPLPGRGDETADSLRRARQWLLAAADVSSAEERAMRLMGLVWTDASPGDVRAAIEAIRRQQDAAGGWSQFGRTEPDAYATGLSLVALSVAGVPPADEAYRNGVAFLLSTQYPDGSWLVRTHAFPVQPYFESGFPFGRHQWISAAATSWAATAIARTLPDTTAGR